MRNLKVKIKRLNGNAVIPTYAHATNEDTPPASHVPWKRLSRRSFCPKGYVTRLSSYIWSVYSVPIVFL